MKTVADICGSSGCFKYFVAGWAFVETLSLAGLKTGWPSLVYIFKQEGIYEHLCDGATGSNSTFLTGNRKNQSALLQCDAQDNVFVWAFTVNVFVCTFVGLILGQINYIFGIRLLRIIAMILGLFGCLCFTFVSPDIPWLIFPGILSMSSGGNALLSSNIQIAYMFDKGSSTVVGLINGAMDISCTVVLLVKIAFEHGVPLSTSFAVLGAMHVLVVMSTFCSMPKYFAKKGKGEESEMMDILISSQTEKSVCESNDEDSSYSDSRRNSILRSYVLSAPYILHVLWSCVCNLLFTMFISTLNPWLEHVTNHDLDLVSYYNDVLFYMMLVTPLISIGVGSMVDCIEHCAGNKNPLCVKLFATAATMYTTTFLGCGLALLLALEYLSLIFITFFIVCAFRSAFYVTMSVFIRNMYRSEYFGMLYGILMIAVGITTALQFPLFHWCQSSDSGYSYNYFFFAGLLFASLCHPIYITIIGIRLRTQTQSAFL